MSTLIRALAASRLPAVTPAAIINAHVRSSPRRPFIHTDYPERQRMRAMLNSAGMLGARVTLAFLKLDGELRYMVCIPVPDADATAAYVTVLDEELSEEAQRNIYRRVRLDTVLAFVVEGA